SNAKLIRHLENGQVTTLLYGGNANMHNIGVTGLADLLGSLIGAASTDTWIIPSVGPDYGGMMDQAPILRELNFPTVMILPIQFPATPAGIEVGIRRFSETLGKPVIIYIKQDRYLSVSQLAGLKADGLLAAIKYAVPRPVTREDPYLSELCEEIGSENIVSGFGERPAIEHLKTFGLAGFTSGCVCIAPQLSMQLLQAIQRKDWEEAKRIHGLFMPMEDQRERISPIRVLHDAITLAGIAEMGPMYPMLSGIPERECANVGQSAKELLRFEMEARGMAVING
ncbi:MAG: dihydrodipicolinate synthase family protein, partial [Verrucomicrobiae bacterium]|nr:dihydrodipicolinate synthase family protein [Verrucomicrobiae bacterium]